MNEHLDILQIAYKQPLMQGQMKLLQHKEKQIPGSVTYSIKRYAKEIEISHYDRRTANGGSKKPLAG